MNIFLNHQILKHQQIMAPTLEFQPLSEVSKVAAPGPLAPPGVSQNVSCVAGAELQATRFTQPHLRSITEFYNSIQYCNITNIRVQRELSWPMFQLTIIIIHPLSVEGSASGAAFPMAQQRSDAARVPATPGGDA